LRHGLQKDARDSKLDFPNATVYSVKNLEEMAKFALPCP